MTNGQYPTISNGLGNLTPDLWRRLMVMLEKFEQQNRDERSSGKETGKDTKPFLARLDKAKCIAPNRYTYSWTEVKLLDDNSVEELVGGRTSTVSTDDYAHGAINVIEIANTSSFSSAGVSMSGQYPSGWTMQAFGGGSCSGTDCEVTLDADVVVLMNKIGGSSTETSSRYVFTGVNEHDGTCASTAVSLSDPIDSVPTIPTDAEYGFLYINSSGNLSFIDKDENIVVFETVP